MHRMGLHSGVFCLVPRRRFSAGKQGARGVVGRMQNVQRLQCIHPTTPRAASYNKEGRLGDEAEPRHPQESRRSLLKKKPQTFVLKNVERQNTSHENNGDLLNCLSFPLSGHTWFSLTDISINFEVY